MNLKQKSLLVLRTIIKNSELSGEQKDFLIEKLDIILELVNPDVLLDEKGVKEFQRITDELRKKGKII